MPTALLVLVVVLALGTTMFVAVLVDHRLRRPRSNDHVASQRASNKAKAQRDIAKQLGFHG